MSIIYYISTFINISIHLYLFSFQRDVYNIIHIRENLIESIGSCKHIMNLQLIYKYVCVKSLSL